MRTSKFATALLCTALFQPLLSAQEEEGGVAYSDEEVKNLIDLFKATAKNKKQPQDDAISTLDELLQAYAYLEAKKEPTKEEIKLQKKMVKEIGKGLRLRKRQQVSLACAKALGTMGHKDGNKPLVRWMETVVLDPKSPNPEWVEYGFLALALIGDPGALDLIYDYGTKARHTDYGVADKALGSIKHFRSLNGKDRKELYNKSLMLIQSLDSKRRQGGNTQRLYQERYDRVKDNCMEALQQLSGEPKPFESIAKATQWYRDNKARKWEDFVGVGFREKPKQPKKEDEGEKEDGKKES